MPKTKALKMSIKSKADGQTAAQQLAVSRGLDAEHTARLVAQYTDLAESRWGNPRALCDGFGRPLNQ
jgi:hypothetical protein